MFEANLNLSFSGVGSGGKPQKLRKSFKVVAKRNKLLDSLANNHVSLMLFKLNIRSHIKK